MSARGARSCSYLWLENSLVSRVIWADTGYNGAPFEQWVKEYLGVRLEMVSHPWTGIRGVWAKEGAVIDWDQILPKGCAYPPQEMGHRTNKCLDYPLPSALSRL